MNHYKEVMALLAAAMLFAPSGFAQDDADQQDETGILSEDEDHVPVLEEVIVTGSIRESIATSINTKRYSNNLVEAIYSEDIGKLPDQNLAEVMENITGVQITRTAGVGTGVQIRGTNANRVLINGVATVGSGAGRSGIDFEDVSSAIISGVEVIKSPDAKTIEGSVGGTINLTTIRPLNLPDTMLSLRLQGEDSSLSTEGIQPRFSGAWGDNWETDAGNFGFVISGSYTEQEAVSFRPRADRDNLASPPGADPAEFLGIQFLLQEQENDDYETTNIATTFEWEPNDNMRFHFDAIINDQQRSRDQYRLQASGVSALSQYSIPSQFEIVDFQVGPGRFPAALAGTLEPDLDVDDDDPNLRFTSETDSRETKSQLFAVGADWQGEKWSAYAELATSESDTVTPDFDVTLNFINPACPLDGSSNDNCVPFIYDLSNNSLAFGVNFDSPFGPQPSDLLDPANVVLDHVSIGRNTNDNSEDAFRLDFARAVDRWGITSVDFGYRYSDSSSEFNAVGDDIGGFSQMEDSPPGTLFAELLVAGPDNYGDADGRSLFIRDFLLVDPDRMYSDPEGTLAILEQALAEWRLQNPDADGDLVAMIAPDQNQYYDVDEETQAFYAQANFEAGMFRGNFGLRYLQTDVDSTSYGPADSNGVRSLQTTSGDYDFLLPRLNIVASPTEDIVLRFGYGKDIRRPDFDDLNTAFVFDQSENAVVALGNPGLSPEEVESFDLSFEWYFAPGAVASVGYFHKDRTDIFGVDYNGALLIPDEDSVSGFVRETDPNCPGGGIYNPDVIPNVLGDPNTRGMCVDFTIPGNDPETTTQSGFEFALAYNLAAHEDKLGWASGFGFIANYTIQDFSGGSIEDCTSGRGLVVLGDVCQDRGLLDFSENAYNITLYYEKYGLTARMRYTWRESFRTQDFAGGANTSGSSTFSFPVNTLDRSQLNASVNYSINDHWDVGVEAVNLTEEPIYQHCVSETGPLCFAGYPDRRIVFGASYQF